MCIGLTAASTCRNDASCGLMRSIYDPLVKACGERSGSTVRCNAARLAQLAGKGDQHLLGEVGELAQQGAEHADTDHSHFYVGLRDDCRAAWLSVENRELAEVSARADAVELLAAAVHDRVPFEDHEQCVAGLTFLDQIDTRRQVGDLGVASDRATLAWRASRKELDVLQQLRQLSLYSHVGSPRAPYGLRRLRSA